MTRFIFSLVFGLALAAGLTFAQNQNVAQSTEVVKVSLVANKARYCVGESPLFAVTGTSNLVGQEIFWSSEFRAFNQKTFQSTGEEKSSYGARLQPRDITAFWSGRGLTWALVQIGTWRKTAQVGGVMDTVEFIVDLCDRSSLRPYSVRLQPEDGSQFFYQAGTDTVQNITVLVEGITDRSMIDSWQVVVNNQNATVAVNNLLSGGLGDVFEHAIPGTCCTGISPAVSIRIPYPLNDLRQGRNEFRIKIWMKDGSEYIAMSSYIVRKAVEDGVRFPAAAKSSELRCQIHQPEVGVGQYAYFYADGGDGSYTWSSPGSSFGYVDAGAVFGTGYDKPGQYTVTLASGSRTVQCNVLVVPGLPAQPQPLPSVPGPNNP